MKKIISIISFLAFCYVTIAQNVFVDADKQAFEIKNELISSISFTPNKTYINMKNINGIIIGGEEYSLAGEVKKTRTICDNLVAPTNKMSATNARGLMTMIPAGVFVDVFAFYPKSSSGSDECIVWSLSSDNKKLVKVKQFTVTSSSSNVQHITELEGAYENDTFVTFHNVDGVGAIGMTRPGVGNDFTLTLSAIENDEYSLLENGIVGNIDMLCLKVSYQYWGNPQKEFLGVGENEHFQDVAKAAFAACWDEIIHIKKGTYKAQVMAFGKKLHLIGESQSDCVIYDDESDYNNPPVEMNIGSIVNLTIKETQSNPQIPMTAKTSLGYDRYKMAYCIHADSGANAQNEGLTIENCSLYNACRPCVGAGLQENYYIKVVNCIFHSGLGWTNPESHQSGLRGTLYFHSNSASTPLQGQRFISYNSIYICEDTITATINTYNGNTVDFTFANCKFLSYVNGESDSIVSMNEAIGTNLVLNDSSFGNNISIFNK